MKNFSIAGLQLNLASFDNKELLTTKIKSTVSRYPWVNMIVVSELAVGGPSRAKKFSLENNPVTIKLSNFYNNLLEVQYHCDKPLVFFLLFLQYHLHAGLTFH